MMKSKKTEYAIVICIQIIAITLFTVADFAVMKNESAILNPFMYIIPTGVALLCIDIGCSLLVFRKILGKRK